MMYNNIVVIGSSGAIGTALTKQLAIRYPSAELHAFSQKAIETPSEHVISHPINYSDENSLNESAKIAARKRPVDLVFVVTGILHAKNLMPEKSLQELSAEKFSQVITANTLLPALLAKYFLPQMNQQNRSVFAALSARVGSISDNQLGGWYSYRASKAALNMIIKSAAIEIHRLNKKAIVVSLHPGTVDSPLSKPFQRYVDKSKLFSPEHSALSLLNVINNLTPEQSGKCFAWDGKEITP
ncbi:MAG: hypothetical protein CENE_01506 [Candidatus Celerinatantimonas neptuna]|nr:MAG: hypothetical protein CENE_01506 [Candidatus Celerinatantimonas neptuna]